MILGRKGTAERDGGMVIGIRTWNERVLHAQLVYGCVSLIDFQFKD